MDLLEIVVGVGTFVGTLGGLYLQHRGNQHFKEQNRIMLEQGGGSAATETRTYKPPAWPMLVMFGMVFACWGAAFYNHYQNGKEDFKKQSEIWDKYTYKPIRNGHYANETVQLDGYEYIGATFDRVTLWYNGTAPTRLTEVHLVNGKPGEANIMLGSSNPVVKQTLMLSNMLGKAAGCGFVEVERPAAP